MKSWGWEAALAIKWPRCPREIMGLIFLGICLKRKNIPLAPIQNAARHWGIKINPLFSFQLWLFLDSKIIARTSSFPQGIIIRSHLASFFQSLPLPWADGFCSLKKYIHGLCFSSAAFTFFSRGNSRVNSQLSSSDRAIGTVALLLK